METTKIFRKMVAWLCDNIDGVSNQTDVARRAKLSPVNVSRIMNGLVKKVKPETLRKVNNAFGNVFNPEWLNGDSDVMLAKDAGKTEPADTAIDDLLAAKDEIIAGLKRELTSKDAVIASKDALINNLQRQFDDLRLRYAMEKRGGEDGRSPSEPAKRSGAATPAGE